jgi:hypothetical protein
MKAEKLKQLLSDHTETHVQYMGHALGYVHYPPENNWTMRQVRHFYAEHQKVCAKLGMPCTLVPPEVAVILYTRMTPRKRQELLKRLGEMPVNTWNTL